MKQPRAGDRYRGEARNLLSARRCVRALAPTSVLLCCLVLLLAGGCRGSRQDPSAAAPGEELPAGLVAKGYAGSAVCTRCHEAVAAEYATSGHGRSAWAQHEIPGVMAGVELPATIDHPLSGFRYEVAWHDGKLTVSERYSLPDGTELATRSEQAFLTVGSGRFTFTSLGARKIELPDGPALELFQLPVTRYRAASVWAMSPGYDAPRQQRFDRGITERCMFCHNGMVEPVPGRTYAFRPPLAHGIGCERCHGPALEHVRFHEESGAGADSATRRKSGTGAGGQASSPGADGPPAAPAPAASRAAGEPLVSLAALSPPRRMEVCQSCHLEGNARVLRQGRQSIFEYRPGQPLADLMWIFMEEDPDPQLFTHSSHGERMVRSRCYTESGQALRCEHCHPAHRLSPKDPGPYNRVCLRCHSLQACTRPARSAAEHRSEKDPCTDCHMRWGGTSDIPHVTTIDHWIRRPMVEPLPGSEAVPDPTIPGVRPHHRGSGRLFPVVGPEGHATAPAEAAAALAAAYFEFAGGANAPDLVSLARQAVQQALAAAPQDAASWRLLAKIEAKSGARSEECRALARAVELDRTDAAAWIGVGTCRGEAGDAEGARQALGEALRCDPRSVMALNRLGYLELRAGRPDEAKRLYERALELDPELASTHHNLAVLHFQQGDLERAEGSWRRAVTLDPLLPQPVEGLVEVLVRQGKREEALRWARQAARLLPGDRLVQKRLAELQGK